MHGGWDHGGVTDGYHLRELPDGGLEFVLEDPVLACLVVADRVTLRFGRTDVVVAEPFDLEVDGVGHRLDPRRHETLGPLLAAYPGTARWLWASPDGELTLVFMQGQRLVAPGPSCAAPGRSGFRTRWTPNRTVRPSGRTGGRA